MKGSPQVMILSKLQNRVQYLLNNYTELQRDPEILERLFQNFNRSGQTTLGPAL